jgi:hypothetical protein
MAYGLTIVSANNFLYAAEPLDGRIAAIRSIDQTPDGGVGFESVNGGRRCRTEHFPTRMLWKGPKGSIIGDFNRQNLLNVSEKAKALIEEWEPGVHQFVPVDFVDAEGNVLEHRYALVICHRLDSVDRQQTTFVLLWGKIWRPAKEVANDYPGDLPAHADLSKPSKIVFSGEKIGSAHLWRDKHIDIGGPFVSKDFAAALRLSGLTGLDLKPEGQGIEEV